MRSHVLPRLLTCLLLVVAGLSISGCENKVTQANFDQITNGMSRSQVEKLLGAGTDDTSSAGYGASTGGVMTSTAAPETTLIWKHDGALYQVIFKDGKVVQKSKRAD